MGAGIAQVALEAGHEVVLYDVDEGRLERGVERIRDGLDARAEKLGLDADSVDEWVDGRLADSGPRVTLDGGRRRRPTSSSRRPSRTSTLKRTIFRALDGRRRPSAILATNTSALSVGGDRRRRRRRPERVARAALLQPGAGHAARRGRGGAAADADVGRRGRSRSSSAGARPRSAAADAPGVHRQPRQPAVHARGAARCSRPAAATIEEIDAAIVAAGYPMGPFELMDLIGIDVNLAAARGIYEGFAGRRPLATFRPSPIQERAGRGRPARAEDGRRVLSRTTAGRSDRIPQRSLGRRRRAPAADAATAIVERIELAIVNEAYRARGEGVATEDDIDLRDAARRRASGRAVRALGRSGADRRQSATGSTNHAGDGPTRFVPAARTERRSRVGSGHESRSLPASPRGVDRVRRADAGRPLRRCAGRVRPDDLAATVLRAVVERARLDPALVEDVILGCANQAGEDNRNVARMAALLAGFPVEVGGLDRQPAVRLGAPGDQLGRPRDRGRRRRRVHRRRRRVDDARAVRDGASPKRPGIAARASCRTRRSAGASSTRSSPSSYYPYSMGETAENVAERWGVVARAAGRLRAREPAARDRGDRGRPVRRPDRPGRGAAAEGRPDGRRARRASARGHDDRGAGQAAAGLPADGGSVTAGNASGINDGASAVLLVEAERARELGLQPDGARRLDGRRRRRSGGHGHRADPGDAQGPRAGRHRASTTSTSSSSTRRSRRSRSCASTSSGSIPPRSTSTAARSRWAIRSG